MSRFADYTDYALWTQSTSETTPTFQEFRKLSSSELQAIAAIIDRWRSQYSRSGLPLP